MPTYTKRERVTVDGREVFYVEGEDGDGDSFVGYEAIPAVDPAPDVLDLARERLAAGGTALTKTEQLALLDRVLGSDST